MYYRQFGDIDRLHKVFPGPVRLCQVVEAEPDVAQRDLLVERLGHGHGQYAPGSGGVQSDLL